MSAEKIQTWLSNPLAENELSVTDISILDQYVTDMISLADVTTGVTSGVTDFTSGMTSIVRQKPQSESDDDYPRVIKKSDLIKSLKSPNLCDF